MDVRQTKANLNVILVGTKFPENIGFASRALKNMGFHRLTLVNPAPFNPSDIKLWAVHADDIVDSISPFSHLSDALKSDQYTIGFTVRQRKNMDRCFFLRDKIADVAQLLSSQKVAFIFGSEDKGLTNADLALCQTWITIPSNAEFPSLNLVQAVMIALYELSMELDYDRSLNTSEMKASLHDIQQLKTCIDTTIKNFNIPQMRNSSWADSLMHILNKRELSSTEINTLMGFFKEVGKYTKDHHLER